MRRAALALGAGVLTVAVLGGVALADGGGLMQWMMGSDNYMAMVSQMRGVLGNEQADAMLASCEKDDGRARTVRSGDDVWHGPDDGRALVGSRQHIADI